MPRIKQVPPELAKQGITRLTDNLEGKRVKLPAGAVVQIFGDELRAHFGRSQGTLDERPASGPGGA